MMEKRYFKVYEDQQCLEDEVSYYEFTGAWCSRQLDIDGQIWRCGERKDLIVIGAITDQPLSVIKFSHEQEIDWHEFEKIWAIAHSKCLSDQQ